MTNKIYLEYLRKSREDIEYEHNNKDYKTLERHKERLKLITESCGKTVREEDIYEEVVSGDSISERPEIQRLLHAIENEYVVGVWVIDVQRLCRGDLGDQDKIIKTFKYTNTLILTPEKEYDLSNPADEEYLIDKLSYSRKEYNNIKKRLNEGRKDSIRNGLYVSGHCAYGYERYKLKGQKGYSLRIIEEQAEIVRLIFKLCLEGKGTHATATYLNNLGIRSPKGGEWKKNGIREMLHNETYVGYVKWEQRKQITVVEDGIIKNKVIRQKKGNYLLVKGIHEPIISKEDFDLVQEKLKSCSTKYVKDDTELKNPLAGIIRCSECCRVMARRGEQVSTYYSPRGSKKNPKKYMSKPIIYCTHKCKTKSHTLEYVEIALIDTLKEWLSENKRIIANYDNNSESIIYNTVNQLEILSKELYKEQNKLNRLRDFLEDGIYDKNTYLERSKVIESNICTINGQIAKITAENEEIKVEKLKTLIPKVELCVNEYFKLETKEKNELLHSIIEKVMYTKTKERNDSDLTLDVYMKI
ncbi:MAG: recombinase family protein [Bacilli bacterium]|nr:recombinase family protein [Bacilli bacterium]